MRLRERTEIERPVARVWPYVIRPEYFQRWNPKISSMDARGEFRLGQPFTTHYRWRAKELQCVSIATEIQDGRVLTLRHSSPVGPGIRRDMEILERVTLEEAGGRTIVTKVVDVEHHGVPWLLLPLIWFVSRFGRPVGPNPLKTMCEAER